MPKQKRRNKLPKLLFVFDHKYPDIWRDGLWAALKELDQRVYDVVWANLQQKSKWPEKWIGIDFALGWGAFNSPVDEYLRTLPHLKRGLCIAGNAMIPEDPYVYDVLFYETEWGKKWLVETILKGEYEGKVELVHAFGINGDIYRKMRVPKIWDVLSVGAFAYWKRHELITSRAGDKIVVGEIQKDNWEESMDIITDLLFNKVTIQDMVSPEKLAIMYNASNTVCIPATVNGGGERAVLEARNCGVTVEVQADNPKLKELLDSPIYDHKYYAEQLQEGIEKVI